MARLCYLSVTNIKKAFCNTWFFGKNKPCVKCGTNKHHKVNLVAAIANVCISDGTFLLLLLSRQEAFFYIPSIPFIVPFLYMLAWKITFFQLYCVENGLEILCSQAFLCNNISGLLMGEHIDMLLRYKQKVKRLKRLLVQGEIWMKTS